MAIFNSSDQLGLLLFYFTVNITGSEFLTYLIMIMIFVSFGFAFRVPSEIILIILLPLMLVLMAYSSSFLIIGGLVLIYLAIVLVQLLAWLN